MYRGKGGQWGSAKGAGPGNSFNGGGRGGFIAPGMGGYFHGSDSYGYHHGGDMLGNELQALRCHFAELQKSLDEIRESSRAPKTTQRAHGTEISFVSRADAGNKQPERDSRQSFTGISTPRALFADQVFFPLMLESAAGKDIDPKDYAKIGDLSKLVFTAKKVEQYATEQCSATAADIAGFAPETASMSPRH